MSTNSMRLAELLGQENEFRNVKSKQNPPADENARIQSKRSAASTAAPPRKRLRVPLGGKDLNIATPALQRSQSLLQAGNVPLTNSRQRQSSVLARPPVLRKSNSSLGFTQTKTGFAAYNPPAPPRPKPQSRGTSLPAEHAARQPELVPRFVTDELRKSAQPLRPPLGKKLADTLSQKTSALNATHVPVELAHHADPVKRGKSGTESGDSHEQLLDRLAEEDSVETVAQQDVAVAPYVPFDEEPLDLGGPAFSEDGRLQAMPMAELEWESDEFAADNKRLELELERSGPVGLSNEELSEMLDF